MQETIKRIEKIIYELEEINKNLDSREIRDAIENLKIFLYSKKIGNESFLHSYVRDKLLKKFKGSAYIESKELKLNLNFRPDIVFLNKDELIIVEIETDKRRCLKKMEKIFKNLDKVYSLPISTNRKVRIIFVTERDEKILRKAKFYNFEVLDIYEEGK
ncbi:hypothetical protein ACPB8Q_03315 [Methanocaldococcus indicus]|uniref:hypothetical protein n=1 Tax=Methanocaldococcus indicus TaxID=213231 RepID=UPI003C6D4435